MSQSFIINRYNSMSLNFKKCERQSKKDKHWKPHLLVLILNYFIKKIYYVKCKDNFSG